MTDAMRKLIGTLQSGSNVLFVEPGFVEKSEDIRKCEETFLAHPNADTLTS